MLGEEADHARSLELAAQAVQRPAGQRDAQPVHGVADAAHDAEVRAHVGGVRDRLREDPRDEDGGGDHPRVGGAALLVLAFEEPAQADGLRREQEHHDAVYDEESPEEDPSGRIHASVPLRTIA